LSRWVSIFLQCRNVADDRSPIGSLVLEIYLHVMNKPGLAVTSSVDVLTRANP
jgi:hypothetical protein